VPFNAGMNSDPLLGDVAMGVSPQPAAHIASRRTPENALFI
jgi:hypothetical protein